VTALDTYADSYANVRMRRRDGILELRLHTDDGPLQWGGSAKRIGDAFADVAADSANRVVILTGTGDAFCARRERRPHATSTPLAWDEVYRDGLRLLTNLLEIGVPTIAAVNGPAHVHAELALLCDIVLAADDTTFSDAPHFRAGVVAGDGVHVVWPLLLGPNRGRYFLLTGQTIGAEEARSLGIVAEVLPRDDLLARAWELATDLAARPTLTLRYTREAITLELKRQLREHLGYGLALEGLASVQLAGWRMEDGGTPPGYEQPYEESA
jgi:enoyl-CoA hydratase/carnithine racemase